MTTTTAVTAVRPGQWIEFCTGKMPATGSTMAASAKDPDLVNKITFLQGVLFLLGKDNGGGLSNPWLYTVGGFDFFLP